MAKLMDEDVRQPKAAQKQQKSSNPPAWIGRMDKQKNSREEDVNPFTGIKKGAGFSGMPEVPAYVKAAVPSPKGPAFLQPGIQNPAILAYVNSANANPVIKSQMPTTVNPQQVQQQIPQSVLNHYTPPTPRINPAANPANMVNEYVGEPVNLSFSDTLRSMQPVERGDGMTFSDMLRSTAEGTPYVLPAWWPLPQVSQPNNSYAGMGSRYGGNWKRGGGGGGGGGYDYGGYGYDENPAWAQNMGLYSLKWGG